VAKRKSSNKSQHSADQPPAHGEDGSPREKKPGQVTAGIRAVRADDGTWELKHPRCARARSDDIEEVEQMIAAGEAEIARDELRWLLADCHDFLVAHKLLGDLAFAEGDTRLARGHFGYAYQIGLKAIERAGRVKPLPISRPGNRAFHEAGKALIVCLLKLGKRGLARDVNTRLLELDPSDPLGLRKLLK
jgi:tetratricopeptide (TPR) repeat protein